MLLLKNLLFYHPRKFVNQKVWLLEEVCSPKEVHHSKSLLPKVYGAESSAILKNLLSRKIGQAKSFTMLRKFTVQEITVPLQRIYCAQNKKVCAP